MRKGKRQWQTSEQACNCQAGAHLHDEVALAVVVEVSFGELQRVEERLCCGEADTVAWLILPHALNDAC